MSRFAAKKTTKYDPVTVSDQESQGYEHGYSFPTSSYTHISKPGLTASTVDEISTLKSEPDWMLQIRHKALEQFQSKPTPSWGADLSTIDYDSINYYLKPTENQANSWDDVPPDVKETFERLGIPQAEREVLAGVKAQYDCLTAEARIFTENGIKKIVDIKNGDQVYALNESTFLLELQPVTGLASKGEREVYEVNTLGGRTIEVTANHPFLSLQHYKKHNARRGRYIKEWKYLSDLQPGDLVALVTSLPDTGKSMSLPKIFIPRTEVDSKNQFTTYKLNIEKRYSKIKIPKRTSPDLLWLLGFYLGDGFLGGIVSDVSSTKRYSRVEFAIPEKEKELRSEVVRICQNLFGYQLRQVSKDRVILNSILFVQLIEKLGFSGKAATKTIPEWVFSLPRAQKLAFIGGYFDADGGVREGSNNALVFTSISKNILESLKLLAISCGLNPSHVWDFSSKYTYKGKTRLNHGHRMQISGEIEQVDSRMSRKKSKFQKRNHIHRFTSAKGTVFRKHTSEHIGFAKILNIKKLGKKPVYDIEVKGYHNFVANGLIVHNSEVVYGSVLKSLEKQGVIFLSMDEGLAKYPDLVREYFGKVIPSGDNKFSALNTASWSGGSFVYVPAGVDVKLPLQTYFRINSSNAGQFERTLIIVDEGAKVHYVEGCFTAGTKIQTAEGLINIEDVNTEDLVLTHTGTYKSVGHTQVRPYTGKLYKVTVTGNPSETIEATAEHPFLVVPKKFQNDRNKNWETKWLPIKDVKPKDYVCIPIDQTLRINETVPHQVLEGRGRHGFKLVDVAVPSTHEFFRLVGYYLAEGSISSGHYLNFSFGSHEREYIEDVKYLLKQVFSEDRVHESHHKTNKGTSVVVRSTKLCRIFEQFGTAAKNKQIPVWMMQEAQHKQQQLILGWFRGDGNYYCQHNKYGLKELFRICTTSQTLAHQSRQLLARLGIATGINKRIRKHEGRQDMYTLIIGGEYIIPFGKLVGSKIDTILNDKKRATPYHIDKNYLYAPVKSVGVSTVENLSVYNFSVEEDESYVAGSVAVHNCTAPNFSSNSLHAAVVEIFVKKGARCQYTTVQNWYKNVYNLVTKRAWVEEEGEMVWTDFNMGSKVTMKYPGFILAGKGARGETLSMALAGAGQHQDTGSKAIHLAPHTSSTIISKSISKDGGRTSYRGMVQVGPKAHNSKNVVICDALLLDDKSRSDTYPVDRIMNSKISVQHEASVSKIGEEQLFYLMSRGISEEDARKMIVNGFIDDLIKKLPLEYAVEMNRLIDHEMEGSIG